MTNLTTHGYRMESCPAEPIRFHEFAEVFPMLEGKLRSEFVEDIRKNGVREPIVMFEGKILDGRNRYLAARECQIEYPVVDFEGDGSDALAYSISLNLNRRHLTESQRAMASAKLAKISHGGDRRSDQAANLPVGPTQSEAASMLSISERALRSAKKVERDGVPELVNAVEVGHVSVSAAADVAGLPKDEQKKIVSEGVKSVRAAAKAVRDTRRNPPEPKPDTPQPPERGAEAICKRVREAVSILSGLPPAGEVVGYFADSDQAILINEQIEIAAPWLDAFAKQWSKEHAGR